MAKDLRHFFGGASQSAMPNGEEKKKSGESNGAKRGRAKRKLVESDEEDEEIIPKKPSPRKTKIKREATPEAETTSTADFFGDSKPKRSAVTRQAVAKPENVATATSAKSRKAVGKRAPVVNYDETNDDDDGAFAEVLDVTDAKKEKMEEDDFVLAKALQEEEDGKDDLFASEYKTTGGKQGDDYEADSDFVVLEDENSSRSKRPAKETDTKATNGRKRKSMEDDEDEDEHEEIVKSTKTSKKATPKKTPSKSAKKAKEAQPEAPEMQAIFDSIPKVRPPTPPMEQNKQKFDFKSGAKNTATPAGAGSIDIPSGAEGCLSGLSFVFTGILTYISREEGQALVKRYDGKVMTTPSGKTSYVVLGAEAGPKKLEVIRMHNLQTINEEGLFELIRRLPAYGGSSTAATKMQEKKEAEMEKIKKNAAEAEMEDRKAKEELKAKSAKSGQAKDLLSIDTRLWTVKHAPTRMDHIIGNKTPVEKLQRWLRMFPKNMRRGFKVAGADASGVYRAVIISGPPGIGKTSAAHLVAKLEGYDIIETNASDTRSKKLVETGLKGVLDTTSLLGYFAGDDQDVEKSKKKICMIMDEVDGMSAGDRGGVGALAAICRKTKVPLILICNDRRLPKMKPFDHAAYDLPFHRPTTEMIKSRIATIAFREGLKLPSNVLIAMIEGTGADVRQIINMLSAAKVGQQAQEGPMDFDRSKEMSKAWAKHVILKPWDIIGKILGGGMFASASKSTLNDKAELYFNDHEMSYLMLQENYLGTSPIRASEYKGREQAYKVLELVEKAADSIGEADLMDRMIHSAEQQWSLMPAHAIASFVRPASFVSGSSAGYGQTRFPAWLGKNSNQSKLTRMVKEIQAHMRLRSSGDRHEIRQQYMPLLWSETSGRLIRGGKDEVPNIIEMMDSYFLTKDDFDAIRELGVGSLDQGNSRNEIASATKAAFTRQYNAQSHPLPFIKASTVTQPKMLSKARPDLEEAIDESDDAEMLDAPDVDEEEDGDLSKDKYVKQPKKKRATKASKAVEVSESEDETEKPKKGKGKAKPAAKTSTKSPSKAPAKGRGTKAKK